MKTVVYQNAQLVGCRFAVAVAKYLGGSFFGTQCIYEGCQVFIHICTQINYVAGKATYIRLLHGKIGFFFGGGGASSVKRGRTHIVLG